jgi:transcriptional regulator with XRE-family HTH domain
MTSHAHPLESTPGALGRSLRGLRKARGITLKELALKIGRSVGFISQIERGLSEPSMTDLRRIAQAFDVPTSWFFLLNDEDSPEQKFIVRAGARRALGTSEEGIVEELLSPDLGGAFEMLRTVIEPGAASTELLKRNTEEAGYVVSGEIEFWIDESRFHLKAGDSFRFDHKSHRWHNRGTAQCIIIWVVSPPTY